MVLFRLEGAFSARNGQGEGEACPEVRCAKDADEHATGLAATLATMCILSPLPIKTETPNSLLIGRYECTTAMHAKRAAPRNDTEFSTGGISSKAMVPNPGTI
jgi:hypothetical protein